MNHSKDDSLATRMEESQDNDEASEPIAQHDSDDDGEPPHFVHELPGFIPRPSGNMVKIKCLATGKLTENKFNRQYKTERFIYNNEQYAIIINCYLSIPAWYIHYGITA